MKKLGEFNVLTKEVTSQNCKQIDISTMSVINQGSVIDNIERAQM